MGKIRFVSHLFILSEISRTVELREKLKKIDLGISKNCQKDKWSFNC